eukprot:CAMPEP_0204167076 /NCGR_PEP_ID=MMETSP0361-20130328/39559_1 /ASSEMBLY_ACC=CAM_ASM_000343 /TAXON_ID=268821 /ORGANISM="Scrippsiella Hangoei, Strain SHTV-5" /LENGTH=97 /DNA_ID=CAMNT_0051124325 /DNA_START=337 /DNA_END=630 /DNA_ORIENTATION=+
MAIIGEQERMGKAVPMQRIHQTTQGQNGNRQSFEASETCRSECLDVANGYASLWAKDTPHGSGDSNQVRKLSPVNHSLVVGVVSDDDSAVDHDECDK